MNKQSHVITDKNVAEMRIDRYLAEFVGIATRNQLKQRLSSLSVNGQPAKLSKLVSFGDRIEFELRSSQIFSFRPEPIKIDIVYEDEKVIVVNKPQGMVVHPAAGNYSGTLVQGLVFHCTDIAKTFDEGEPRPGIVHRLDKDTSGILIAAKNPETQEFLSAQFRKRKTEKKYYALCKGRLNERKGKICTNIARDPRNRKKYCASETQGKPAETYFEVLRLYDEYTFVALRPITGRTHQLRVHLLSKGHPILGDSIYARTDQRYADTTLMLHAYSLKIRLPGSVEPKTFRAPLPERFKRILNALAS